MNDSMWVSPKFGQLARQSRARLRGQPMARQIVGGLRLIGSGLKYPRGSPDWVATRLMVEASPDVLVDVGANVGQYSAMTRRSGFKGRILSFEPVGRPFSQLAAAAAKDPLWSAVNCGLGAHDGVETMHVSMNDSLSSSILNMGERHARAFPEARVEREETICVRRLDQIAHPYLVEAKSIFLKVDAQGYESHVLEGATEILDRVVGLRLELSLRSLYDGDWDIWAAFDWLRDHEFRLRMFLPGASDPTSGEPLQVDAVATRISPSEDVTAYLGENG